MACEELQFNKQLRQVTREIHNISDVMVNGKLAFALSADKVWAEGLLVFYEVFKYLEDAITRNKDGNLGTILDEDIFRTEAFEKDLDYYLGKDWKKTYKIRPAVGKYLSHLQSLEEKNPDLLVAYIYHLYMGLLSGGQILKRKRALAQKIFFFKSQSTSSTGGVNLTDFGNNNIYNMKRKIINSVNALADNLDQETKDIILEESKTVFLLNNEIVSTIEGTKEILVKKCLQFSIICALSIIFIYYL